VSEKVADTKMECDIGDLQAERDHARAMVGIAINLIVAEAKEFCPKPETCEGLDRRKLESCRQCIREHISKKAEDLTHCYTAFAKTRVTLPKSLVKDIYTLLREVGGSPGPADPYFDWCREEAQKLKEGLRIPLFGKEASGRA